jgi:hypothetical protein
MQKAPLPFLLDSDTFKTQLQRQAQEPVSVCAFHGHIASQPSGVWPRLGFDYLNRVLRAAIA